MFAAGLLGVFGMITSLQGGGLGGKVVCEISQTCRTVEPFVPAASHESGVPGTLI